MRVPEVLLSLADQGVIDEVVRPLKSGKEAQVYLVRAGGEARVAKVYKDADHRSFKQRAQYTEGRRVRNTRDQRAIERHTRHGKAQEEDRWKSAEVDVIHRLHAHGVRVPTPYNYIDGVLIMELVRGDDGHPAPRLSELDLDRDTARSYFDRLLKEVVKMLCAGIVHGDLSDYNVLVDPEGPVIIDFPQSVDASVNRNARQLLVRDVDNLSAFLARCVPNTRRQPYGQELWAAYESNMLTPDLELKGTFRRSAKPTDMSSLLEHIEEADSDERRRREKIGQAPPTPRKREVIIVPAKGQASRDGSGPRSSGPGRNGAGRNAGQSGGPRNHQGARSQGNGAAARGAGEQGAGKPRGQGDASRRDDRRGAPATGRNGAPSSRGPNDQSDPRRRAESPRGPSDQGDPRRRAESPRGASDQGDPRRRAESPRGASDQGDSRRRAESPSIPRDEAARANGEGAPKRRRRRRRAGSPNGGPQGEPRRDAGGAPAAPRDGAPSARAPSNASAPPAQSAGARSEGSPPDSGGAPKPRRRRRRRRSGPNPQAGGATS